MASDHVKRHCRGSASELVHQLAQGGEPSGHLRFECRLVSNQHEARMRLPQSAQAVVEGPRLASILRARRIVPAHTETATRGALEKQDRIVAIPRRALGAAYRLEERVGPFGPIGGAVQQPAVEHEAATARRRERVRGFSLLLQRVNAALQDSPALFASGLGEQPPSQKTGGHLRNDHDGIAELALDPPREGGFAAPRPSREDDFRRPPTLLARRLRAGLSRFQTACPPRPPNLDKRTRPRSTSRRRWR